MSEISHHDEVQKKTFTRWLNYHLSAREIKVEDLFKDCSGIVLINLVEILSDKKCLKKYNKKPRMDIHKTENLDIALKFIKLQAIKLVGIGPSDLFAGNPKSTLGLIWTLLLRYSVGGGDDLLAWVNKQIEKYEDVPLATNFTSSWADGKVFTALVDSLIKKCPLEGLTGDALKDTQRAGETARDEMGIPIMVDAENMINDPDEHSNMTYIAVFKEWVEKKREARRQALKDAIPDAGSSYAEGPGLKTAVSGHPDPAVFQVHCLNPSGDPAAPKFLKVAVTGPGGEAVKSFATADEDGTNFDCGYHPTVPGEHTVTVQLEGKDDIKDTPVKVLVLEGAVASKTAVLRGALSLQARLADGSQKTSGEDEWKASVEPAEAKVAVEAQDNNDGTYGASYELNLQQSGTQTVKATLNGEDVPGAPVVHTVQ